MTPSNSQTGTPPLVSCPRLSVHFISMYPPYAMPFSTDTSVMTKYPNFLPVQRPYLDILMITLAYSSSITGCLSVNTHRKVTNNTNLSVQTAQTTDSANFHRRHATHTTATLQGNNPALAVSQNTVWRTRTKSIEHILCASFPSILVIHCSSPHFYRPLTGQPYELPLCACLPSD